MNRSLTAAWLAGEAIVCWRMVHQSHRLPVPGALLGITGLFLAMALVSDIVPRAATLISLTAWGLDVAAFLNALPAGLAGQITQSEQSAAIASGQAYSGAESAGAGAAGRAGAAAGR